jgi:uncharacterized protein
VITIADTSALVAAYVREERSAAVVRHLLSAEVVAVSHLAWGELHAALARLQREQRLDPGLADQARDRIRDDWATFVRVRVDQRLHSETARLLRQHLLRGADAVHLASALLIHRRLAEPSGQQASFLVADAALARAAVDEGLSVPAL